MLDVLSTPPISSQQVSVPSRDWSALAETVGKQCCQCEVDADNSDRFVAENFEILKSSGLSAAGVPREFGGGGATFAEICDMLQILGRYCSSTALAFAMHTHQVMVLTWKWHHKKAPVGNLLARIASEKLILLSSGGSDWLPGSGTAVRVEGGYAVTARKVFSSGSPAGDILITSAIYDDPEVGPTVLHFPVPMTAAGVSLVPNWQAMGMRGTGSHDIVLSNVFVPEEKVALRRTPGKWHAAFHLVTAIAIPIVYSVYVGVAEAARILVVEQARKRRDNEHVCYKVGELETELTAARIALKHMISTSEQSQPGFETTNQIMMGRSLVEQAVLKVVDRAMDVAGGRAFHRPFGLEKLFRDAQGVRYHPIREEQQRKLAGQLALGCPHDSL